MITRIWHGRTKEKHADEYLAFLVGEGTDEYRSVEETFRRRSGEG